MANRREHMTWRRMQPSPSASQIHCGSLGTEHEEKPGPVQFFGAVQLPMSGPELADGRWDG